jgi:hypothetical protein
MAYISKDKIKLDKIDLERMVKTQNKTILNLSDLVGEEISAVSFVQNYVEFHFNGPVLRSVANPKAITANSTIQFPEIGSREVLCQFIGQTVRIIELKENDSLTIVTNDNYTLIIPLDPEHSRGHENMHFKPNDSQPQQIW